MPAAKSTATPVPRHSSLGTNTHILICGIIGLVVIILTVVVGRSLVKNILLNNRVIHKQQTAQHQLEANLTAIQQLAQSYSGLEAIKKVADNSLPVTEDYPGLVSMMEATANASSLKLTSITPADASNVSAAEPGEAPAGGTVPYIFNVTISGSQANLTLFLKNLELASRPMYIHNISVTGTSQALQASLQIQTYYRPAVAISDKTEVVK